MSPYHFPTTAWSLNGDAAGPAADKARDTAHGPAWHAALNRRIVAYWRPVFHFIRGREHDVAAAKDLTRESCLKLLERDWIGRAGRSRGRFRPSLSAVLTRFLADQGPKRAPRQKAFDEVMVNVSPLVQDEDRLFQPSDTTTPEQLFMKHWAEALVDDVRRELEAWCGRPDWYAIFSAHHFPPSTQEHPTQDELARRDRARTCNLVCGFP